MTITYTLHKEDYLAFQLFIASTSKRIQEKKKNSWLSLTIVFLMVAAFFYLERNNFLAIWFGVSAIITGMFYPAYFNWTHKKHYSKYVEEHNINRFGQEENLTIKEEVIASQNNLGDGNIKISAISEIFETKAHFFLKMISGLSLIIPKIDSIDVDVLREKFLELGLEVNDCTDWKW